MSKSTLNPIILNGDDAEANKLACVNIKIQLLVPVAIVPNPNPSNRIVYAYIGD